MIWVDLFGISGEDAEQAHFDFFFILSEKQFLLISQNMDLGLLVY